MAEHDYIISIMSEKLNAALIDNGLDAADREHVMDKTLTALESALDECTAEDTGN